MSAATGPLVLVVDDEPEACRACARLLGQAGYAVRSANSGEEAVAAAAAARPAAILLDLNMPGMGGLGALRALRAQCPGSVVIVLTGHGTIGAAREAMLLGAHEFVTKPFDTDFLLATLRGALGEGRGPQAERPCAP